MKLPNLVSKSHQAFASVFLAFSPFGFVSGGNESLVPATARTLASTLD